MGPPVEGRRAGEGVVERCAMEEHHKPARQKLCSPTSKGRKSCKSIQFSR
jgi:hypothetical protein